MRLGLLADIHEDLARLRAALQLFAKQRVEQVVVLGDLFEMGQRIEETCRLLADVRAVGVWGNHDIGLCRDPGPRLTAKYGAQVIGFMGSLQPRLEIAQCLFTHVEPWLDPYEVADLWYYEGPPDTREKYERIFAAAPHSLMFAGHYHGWLLVRPQGTEDWQGDRPLMFPAGQRYFLVVGAVCDGHAAVFDTESREFVPLRVE